MKPIIGISCLNYNKSIGINNKLLFNLKSDMLYFKNVTSTTKNITKKNAVIMGANTYFSIPKNYRPLDNRINLIVTQNQYNKILDEKTENMKLFSKIDDTIEYAYSNDEIESIFVIGGETIYKHFMKKNYYNKLLLNEIKWPENNIGNKFFPDIPENLYQKKSIQSIKEKSGAINYWYNTYDYTNIQPTIHKKKSFNEEVYLDNLKDILDNGEVRETRNSKVYSKFGVTMSFDISEKFPLLTTKKMYWKGIVGELLWFLKGETDSKILEKQNINIWKKNSSQSEIDKLQLPYQEGWCGPIYGFQWRHFNADYVKPSADYSNQGIDQLQNCIDLIKNDPYSRRIFMTAWNPVQLKVMVLPPCNVSYQFYVSKDKKLSCQMYQRSGDMFLGVPFNIASTSLLVQIIAKMTNLQAGKVNIVIGDAHIYDNHVSEIQEQLKRKPYPLPIVNIKIKRVKIENYLQSDIELKYYNYYPGIQAEMIA